MQTSTLRSWALCLTLICCLSNANAAEQAPSAQNTLTAQETADGWISLFDGETLYGWTPNSEANWAVKDGILSVSEGKGGLLCTNSEFGDYHLQCDFRAPEKTNSALFLRTLFKPKSLKTDCYELNIAPPDNPFPTGGFVQREKATGAEPKYDDWNTFDVLAEGGHFVVKLNGKQVLDYTDPGTPIRCGMIGLQLNSGLAEFRNIKLKPLGLKPIFNGKDRSSVTHLQRAKLHWKLGELDQARVELDAAARRDSFSWRVLYYRAWVSKDLGDRAATRAAIDQLLERSPGNYAGLSLRAKEELDAGRLACAEQDFARLVAREPLYFECVNVGYARSRLGRYREALEGYRCALAIRPDDPTARLDVAESLLLAGNASDAGEQFRALRELLVQKRARSPAGKLEGSDLLVEAQTLAYLGRDDPAVAADARARVAELVTPTARLSVFASAALVHAILGDRALAARYVAQYLDRGGAAAKLSDPWFDDLRRDPVLGPRLAIAPVARTCEAGSAP